MFDFACRYYIITAMNKKILLTAICFGLAAGVLAGCNAEPSMTESEATEQPSETTEAEVIETQFPTEQSEITVPAEDPESDVTAPFFINITREAYVTQGTEFDIDSFLSYIDDYDSDVELIVEGMVDTSTIGTYPLSLTLVDDYGNTSSDSITVYVVEPVEQGSGQDYVPGTTTADATSFGSFRSAYTGENIHYGIDVSHWQGAIDWVSVKNAGCEFAFIRAGWSSEGEFHEDEYFRANMEGASAAGIPIGIYVYTTDNTAEYVEALADTVCDMADGYNVVLPIVFDWENFFSNFQKYGLSISDVNDLYDVFESRVESRGYQASIYGSKFILEIIWDDDIETVWLAHYTSQTDYAGNYYLWQQSCTGSIPGIDAYVDLDLFYGDIPGGSNG